MRFLYTPEMDAFIMEHLKGTSNKELTELVNEQFGLSLTCEAIRSYKSNRHLSSGAPKGNPRGFSKTYTKEVQDYIAAHVVGVHYKDLTEMVNAEFGTEYGVNQITAYCNNHSLRNGMDCRFTAGTPSPTKGKHIPSKGRSVETQFKSGELPHNTKPVGYIRLNRDGYLEIKTKMRPTRNNDNFALLQRKVWAEHNGPIPKGGRIVFLDGDKLNCDISNLALISAQELQFMNRNNLFSTDPELTRTGIAIAKLYTTARKLEKQNSDDGKASAEELSKGDSE